MSKKLRSRCRMMSDRQLYDLIGQLTPEIAKAQSLLAAARREADQRKKRKEKYQCSNSS